MAGSAPPDHERHSRRGVLRYTAVAAVSTVVLVLTVLFLRDRSSGVESSARGAPTPAVCPATFEVGRWPGQQTRHGRFLPKGATEALLCRYPFAGASINLPLKDSVALSTPSGLVDFFNGIPEEPQAPNTICTMKGITQYAIAVAYHDRPAAVVHLGCGAEQSGAVRYNYDSAAVLGFWGLPPTG